MGGKALKNTKTRRVKANEYHNKIKPELLFELNKLFPNTQLECIQSFESKPDFGDIDIIMALENTEDSWRYSIIDNFNPKDVFFNKDKSNNIKKESVFSFEFKDFQVDIIPIQPKYYNFAKLYYAYNDLGNFIGKIAKELGLKFGHKGLSQKVFNPYKKNEYDNILITNNFYQAIDFLGFDAERYKEGFKDTDDIFDFIIQSKYFSKEIFQFKNMRNKDRIRDAKRPNYNLFLKKLEKMQDSFFDPNLSIKMKNQAFERFPSFQQSYNNKLEQFRIKNEIETNMKHKFNGNIIKKATNLNGKEIGNFITSFKNSFDNEQHFQYYLLNNEKDKIEKDIIIFSNKNTKKLKMC